MYASKIFCLQDTMLCFYAIVFMIPYFTLYLLFISFLLNVVQKISWYQQDRLCLLKIWSQSITHDESFHWFLISLTNFYWLLSNNRLTILCRPRQVDFPAWASYSSLFSSPMEFSWQFEVHVYLFIKYLIFFFYERKFHNI